VDAAWKHPRSWVSLFEQEGEYAIRINEQLTIEIVPSAAGMRDQDRAHRRVIEQALAALQIGG
jgi:hypothetical protein